jgi:hypothetical protein
MLLLVRRPVEVVREVKEFDHVKSIPTMSMKWGFLPWPDAKYENVYKMVPQKSVEMQSVEVAVCCDGYQKITGACVRKCQSPPLTDCSDE